MAYQPPKQSLAAQIFDVITLLVLTVGALYLPLYLGLAGAAKTPAPIANPTWEALGQNTTEQAQWAALGITDPSAANDIITARFDYYSSISTVMPTQGMIETYDVSTGRGSSSSSSPRPPPRRLPPPSPAPGAQ